MTPIQFSESTIWWTGPSWLLLPPSSWLPQPQPQPVENLEERLIKVVTVNCFRTKVWNLLHRYPSLTKLTRITAVCQRAIARFKKIPETSLCNPITTSELKSAVCYWIKTVQSVFAHEFKLLSDLKTLPRSYPMNRLTPFVDKDGILRVGERLEVSSLSASAKHPAILPKDSPFTILVISDAHLKTFHGETQITLSLIREEFWIIGGRNPIRSYILKCVKCARFRQQRAQQLMANSRQRPYRLLVHFSIPG